MGRLSEFLNLINSDNLEEDSHQVFHLDVDEAWPHILEARKLLRKQRLVFTKQVMLNFETPAKEIHPANFFRL